MKSVTHTRFGTLAWKLRLSRSGARRPSVSGIVVRTFFDRRMPCRPNVHIARCTEPAEASGSAARRIRAVILRRP
ncbi:Uncharacterised protein [Mycobacteroides abscessus subsp. abscessus]|nr:Uncharacterised protein [Mycobacteroides abscessus subsp. abscessus]